MERTANAVSIVWLIADRSLNFISLTMKKERLQLAMLIARVRKRRNKTTIFGAEALTRYGYMMLKGLNDPLILLLPNIVTIKLQSSPFGIEPLFLYPHQLC
ncbi:unnamed protein product [Dicrocoelium dendriticum]|nr:unnamed protein product [Dicrocoelium dendriticum]